MIKETLIVGYAWMRAEYERLMTLKNLVRTGWMQRGVPAAIGETVAQHCFEAAILALLISRKLRDSGINVNPEKAAVIALLHDIGESLMGDVPRWTTIKLGGVKEDIEANAARLIAFPLGLHSYTLEALKVKGLEARVARIAELLATALQAQRYVSSGYASVNEILEGVTKELSKELLNPPLNVAKDLVAILLGEEL